MQQNIQETNLRVYGYNDLHENALPHELHKALESGGARRLEPGCSTIMIAPKAMHNQAASTLLPRARVYI